MRYESAIKYFFLTLFSVANDSQLFFFNGHMRFFRVSQVKFFFSESNDVLKVIVWSIAD
jgi:hypothetical protein